MEIKVVYLGLLAEKTGRNQEQFKSACAGELAVLKKELETLHPSIKNTTYSMAVNNEIQNVKLHDGDEVALLPPFAGG